MEAEARYSIAWSDILRLRSDVAPVYSSLGEEVLRMMYTYHIAAPIGCRLTVRGPS